jgi:hypothetical protein
VGGGLALAVPVELGFRRRRLWGRIHHWRLRGGWGEGGGAGPTAGGAGGAVGPRRPRSDRDWTHGGFTAGLYIRVTQKIYLLHFFFTFRRLVQKLTSR